MGKATVSADVCLFDLDGTIVNTTKAVEHIWEELCKEHGVEVNQLYEYSHGRRTAETLARFFPKIDNTNNRGAHEFEEKIVSQYSNLVEVIPGQSQLLNALEYGKWCIVTSGNKKLAFGWFDHLLSDVKRPEVFITAEMVTVGKPNPEGYLRGAQLLSEKHGLDHQTVRKVVFEDAPVGIAAGVDAGALVIGIASGFDPELLYKAGAAYVVNDLTHVKVIDGSKIELKVEYIDRI
jgi:2-deoxyglucose-6-phosphatase